MSSGMEKNEYPLSAGLYVGQTPWHWGMSNSKMVDKITIELLREFYSAEPVKVPVYAFNPATGMPIQMPDTFVTGICGPDGTFYRFTEAGKAVSEDYEFLSNAQMVNGLAPWLENDIFEPESATKLFNGAKTMLSGRGQSVSIKKGDELRRYLCVYNTHNGQGGGILFCQNRVDCDNMLRLAISQATKAGKIVKFRHGPFVSVTYEQVLDTVSFAQGEFIATEEKLRWLATKGVDTQFIKKFSFVWNSLDSIPVALDKYSALEHEINQGLKTENALRANFIEQLERQFNNPNAGTYGQDAYDLLNAATYLTSHGTEGRRLNGEDLLDDNLYGNGARKAQRALDTLMAIASK